MYCPNCGREIPDGSKFCPYCGFEIKGKKEEVRGIRREKRKSFVSIITIVIILTSVFLLIKFLPGINMGKTITWAKTFGGSGGDEAYSVQQTKDGGYIVAGYTTSFGAGDDDFLVVKLDGSGNKEWAKTFGGSDKDYARSVQQTKDGGYIVAGYTDSFSGGWEEYHYLIIKLDGSGDKEWAKTFGGGNDYYAFSIQHTEDGGYIVAGYTKSFDTGDYDYLIIKLDGSGNKEWAKTFGGSGVNEAYSVQQTEDGGYIVAGRTGVLDTGNYDYLIIKLDGSGNKEWAKTFGGSGVDGALSVQQTGDEGYIVAGWTISFDTSNYDSLIVKLDKSGNKEWAKTFGGSDKDYARSVQQTKDGGYIVAGATRSFGAGDWDYLIIKLDKSGNEEWAKTFGGSDFDEAFSIRQTEDGGYIVAGRTGSFGAGDYDYLIIKLDKSGNIDGSCDYLKSCSPIVKSISNSTANCDPAVNLPSVNASSCNIKTSSPDIQETTICKP